jgi:hypothetical protein
MKRKKCLDIIYGAGKKGKKLRVDQKLMVVRAGKVEEMPEISTEEKFHASYFN